MLQRVAQPGGDDGDYRETLHVTEGGPILHRKQPARGLGIFGPSMTASIPSTGWKTPGPARLVAHGRGRLDPWYWLRQRDNPAVIAYLRAENAHADAVMAHTRPLQERLFAEIKGRIKQTDMSVPYRIKRYLYYTRVEDGLQYPLHCRRRAAPGEEGEGAEDVLLDVNALARGHDFYAVNVRDVSPGEDILAFAEVTRGDRAHTIRFRQLAPEGMLDEPFRHPPDDLA